MQSAIQLSVITLQHGAIGLFRSVNLPQMDGLALTMAIRSNPEIEKLPVIVYSSIGDIGMKTSAEFLKADAHVTKLNVEELVNQVIRLTAGAKIADRSGEDCKIKEPSNSATIDNNDDTADVSYKAEESALAKDAAAGQDTDDCFSSFDYMAASLEAEGAIHPQADELCPFESESKGGFDENRLMINIPENGPGMANLKTNGKTGKKKKSRTGKRTDSGKILKAQAAKKIKKSGPPKRKANAKAR